MTVPELIEQASKKNVNAQRKLFDYYYEECLTYCNVRLKNRHDAEDVVSECFAAFFVRLHVFKYQGEKSVINWLKGFIRLECHRYRRTYGHWMTAEENAVRELTFEDVVMANLSAKDLMDLIMRLREPGRSVFILSAIEGLSHAEISSLLKININTSRIYLKRSKAYLQSLIISNSPNHGN
ncbi:RNA polymerase sigma factor [Ferruginibacter sp. HRS2-29]|uniref:RNA polymerase sigma factor n=1 Tax=Ferruginibacter sp. HRS2-29 TaxID=2487334 RepID=UPI0020CBF2A7|nr:sigma-70 family RNA polymerase sigma factor [Ferruginibacter sp. HRS2-29]MCP9752799.1 sigma-70 family RNA polymerase sigma factor [Ferruginibacter sp. HRS2-29]